MPSIAHFKTNVYEYLETLPPLVFNRLFQKPATCLAIFRLLSSLARQMVMSVLYVEQAVLVDDMKQWMYHEGQAKLEESLKKILKLHIFTKENDHIIMNSTFRKQFQIVLQGGDSTQSFGLPCPAPDKNAVDIPYLDAYANEQWERILHFMVGTTTSQKPPLGVLNLLERSGLMARNQEGMLVITNKGFQFLLQDVNTQVWAFLIQYLDSAETLGMDLVEVLNFFFQLGSLELGRDYATEMLTQTQTTLLGDLRHHGLVYQRKVGSRRFYPTRLATTLTSGTSAFTGPSGTKIGDSGAHVGPASQQTKEEVESEQGFLIIETNYKVYAYTNSPLQIAVLNLFMSLRDRFPNMVAGQITRDSVRAALRNGITADQIISYMRAHAHPQMRKQTPLLPLTVVDQIRLWEMERDRMGSQSAYLYKEFKTQEDYQVTEKYARDVGALLWSSRGKRMLAVSAEGHETVRNYLKKRMAARQQ